MNSIKNYNKLNSINFNCETTQFYKSDEKKSFAEANNI